MKDAKRRLIDRLKREVSDKRVVQAMARVPREVFVPEESRHLAYEDIPLSIGQGQTISQPYIVALMLRALQVQRTDKVLEVGTGSGYQAAILAELARTVISVERIASLAASARDRLDTLGYDNVKVVLAERQLGWAHEAPYNGIIVAAGAPKLIRTLMDQMATGGRLVIPVGPADSQELMKVTRSNDTYSIETMGACRFVPLIGEEAWPDKPSSVL